MPGSVYLMYHEIELSGREMCQRGEGYSRYVLREADFRAQVAHLRTQGFRGINVTQDLEGPRPEGRPIVLTFDDGCETDLIVAAPVLQQAGFGATFYVVSGFIGRRGYLSRGQLLELATMGFEIGCHSRTHPYLTDLSPDELGAEMIQAKQELENWIGQRVVHFSCPGGRWDQRVAVQGREAGYRSVATSRIGVNTRESDPYRLARVAIMRETSLRQFDRLCQAKGFRAKQARSAILASAKGIFGNWMYEKLRGAFLGDE